MELPGYTFDGKRYYKIQPGAKPPPSRAAKEPSDKHTRKKLRRTKEKGKWKALEPSSGCIRNVLEGHPGRVGVSRKLHHEILCLGMKRVSLSQKNEVDCLPVGEIVRSFCFDDDDPSTIRAGGSTGSIGSVASKLSESEEQYWSDYGPLPHDLVPGNWSVQFMLHGSITSIQSCQGRILATSLGSPAQAIVGSTSGNLRSASVTLSPPKTSLWTSALSPDLVALGCDRKVLISRDPSRGSMDSYITGGRHGDGSVFALDLTQNLIYAGMRSGTVKVFDSRSSPTSKHDSRSVEAPESRAEVQLSISSSVTHTKRLGEGLLVVGMDGSIGMYDLRFIRPRPTPILKLEGHVNSYTTAVGLDVWKDEFLAICGQDGMVRLWSLRTGLQIHNTTSPSALQFEYPIHAIRFSDSLSWSGRKDNGDLLDREEEEKEDTTAGGRRRWEGPKLWLADGITLKCFGF